MNKESRAAQQAAAIGQHAAAVLHGFTSDLRSITIICIAPYGVTVQSLMRGVSSIQPYLCTDPVMVLSMMLSGSQRTVGIPGTGKSVKAAWLKASSGGWKGASGGATSDRLAQQTSWLGCCMNGVMLKSFRRSSGVGANR